MAQTSMTDWRVTATTIYCDAVDDEVTLLVYRDGSTKCTGYGKSDERVGHTVGFLKRMIKRSGRGAECDGPECYRILQYRDKLFAE